MKTTSVIDNSFYLNFGKRIIDIILSIVFLVFTAPLFLIISIILYFSNDKQILFKQLRPGLHTKIFEIWKFKTMTDNYDHNGKLLPDHKRITFIGNILRKLSLDELPQLINILKGEMSFVGPRPLLIEYLNLYSSTQQLRHHVKPGITGLAQINGRNSLDWKYSLKYDSWYSKNVSFCLDLHLFLKTIVYILMPNKKHNNQIVLREPFNGNQL